MTSARGKRAPKDIECEKKTTGSSAEAAGHSDLKKGGERARERSACDAAATIATNAACMRARVPCAVCCTCVCDACEACVRACARACVYEGSKPYGDEVAVHVAPQCRRLCPLQIWKATRQNKTGHAGGE